MAYLSLANYSTLAKIPRHWLGYHDTLKIIKIINGNKKVWGR